MTGKVADGGNPAGSRRLIGVGRPVTKRLGAQPWEPLRWEGGGRWRYVHRAIDQNGQIIDIYLAAKRDSKAARAFVHRALATARAAPSEIVTDRAPVYPKLVDELAPAAWHRCEQYANNRLEADHGLLKRRLRPMRHLRNDRTATVIIRGHALIQNLRRGHYHLTAKIPARLRLAAAFDELSHAI